MTMKLFTLMLLSTAAVGVSACSTMSPTDKPPGTYKTTSESTNSNGTNTKTQQTTDVYRDANGNKKATVKTETTKDPEGLFNKSTSTTVKDYR